jgi:HK97 family phage prohead protease
MPAKLDLKASTKMQVKDTSPELCKLSIMDDGTDYGYIEGYASVFNVVDSYGDTVLPGAFKKTLRERLKNGSIKLLDQHRTSTTDALIGVIEEAHEDEKGLWFKARFSCTALAQNARIKIKEGILDALSIGYRTIKGEPDKETDGYKIKEVKLYEISLVIWGANPDTFVEAVKSEELETSTDVEETDTTKTDDVENEADTSTKDSDLVLQEAADAALISANLALAQYALGKLTRAVNASKSALGSTSVG